MFGCFSRLRFLYFKFSISRSCFGLVYFIIFKVGEDRKMVFTELILLALFLVYLVGRVVRFEFVLQIVYLRYISSGGY